MKDKYRISKREYQDRLQSLLKDAVNTQLRPLMSLETATKNGERKKKTANNSGFAKSTTTTLANGAPNASLQDDIATLLDPGSSCEAV